MKDYFEDDDMIIIYDGICLLVDELVLLDVIVKCKEFGNGVIFLFYNE